MSSVPMNRMLIRCDSCEVMSSGEHPTAMEARAAAYVQGWRFPPRIGINGKSSPNRTDDLCPSCVASRES